MPTPHDEKKAVEFLALLPQQTKVPQSTLENDTLQSVRGELESIDEDAWSSIDDNILFPKDKVHKEGKSVGICSCVGTVQTSPEQVLCSCFSSDSDYDMAKHVKANGNNLEQYPNLIVSRINHHHRITYACRKLPFPLVARDWLQRVIFTQQNGDKFVLVWKFVDKKSEDVPIFAPSTLKEGEKRIRGEFTAVCTFERLPHDCCKFTYIVKVSDASNEQASERFGAREENTFD